MEGPRFNSSGEIIRYEPPPPPPRRPAPPPRRFPTGWIIVILICLGLGGGFFAARSDREHSTYTADRTTHATSTDTASSDNSKSEKNKPSTKSEDDEKTSEDKKKSNSSEKKPESDTETPPQQKPTAKPPDTAPQIYRARVGQLVASNPIMSFITNGAMKYTGSYAGRTIPSGFAAIVVDFTMINAMNSTIMCEATDFSLAANQKEYYPVNSTFGTDNSVSKHINYPVYIAVGYQCQGVNIYIVPANERAVTFVSKNVVSGQFTGKYYCVDFQFPQ